MNAATFCPLHINWARKQPNFSRVLDPKTWSTYLPPTPCTPSPLPSSLLAGSFIAPVYEQPTYQLIYMPSVGHLIFIEVFFVFFNGGQKKKKYFCSDPKQASVSIIRCCRSQWKPDPVIPSQSFALHPGTETLRGDAPDDSSVAAPDQRDKDVMLWKLCRALSYARSHVTALRQGGYDNPNRNYTHRISFHKPWISCCNLTFLSPPPPRSSVCGGREPFTTQTTQRRRRDEAHGRSNGPFFSSTQHYICLLRKMDQNRRVVARRATHAQVRRRTLCR